MTTYITRKKVGKTYRYFNGETQITDTAEIDRINALVIPPAWKKVEIAKATSAKVQARGYDGAGRLQSIYNAKYRLKQEKAKFDRILRFANKLPALRKQIDKDLSRKLLTKDKVLACIVKLIDEAYFRVGNEKYARDHQSYGITTLQSKHVIAGSSTITFDFTGKSGIQQSKKIKDPQLARVIKRLDELPGKDIFRYVDSNGDVRDLHSSDVNSYIKTHMGDEFSAKDFRTWGGTLLATTEVLKDTLANDATQAARKKFMTKVVKRVARRLGNTPAIARSSYIDPRVFAAYENGKSLEKVKGTIQTIRPKKYLSVDEQSVLKLLQASR